MARVAKPIWSFLVISFKDHTNVAVWIPARVSTNHVGTEPALSEVEGVAKLFVSRGRPRPQIFREGRDLTANQICHRERSKTALSAVSPSRTTPCSSIPAAAHRGILCTLLIDPDHDPCHPGGREVPRTHSTPNEGPMHFVEPAVGIRLRLRIRARL